MWMFGSTRLYISDAGNNRIRQMVIFTLAVTTFAGGGCARTPAPVL